MGKAQSMKSVINEVSLKPSMKSVINDRPKSAKQDYMVEKAAKQLKIDRRWWAALYRGAYHLSEARFWAIVEASLSAKDPARYCVKSILNEA